MSPVKSFKVLGDPVDILTTGEMTGGRSCMLVETCQPGGGPPPHSHKNEDETFYVLEGEFEILSGGQWHNLASGEAAQGNRGAVHTFRNSGTTTGKILIFASPAGLRITSKKSRCSHPTRHAADSRHLRALGITFAL